ncbi:hypothetical protein D3C76_1556400 [compost metagenome]
MFGIQQQPQPCFFLLAEPRSMLGAIHQAEPGQQAQDRCGQALHQEQPLPAMPAIEPIQAFHDSPRQGACDQAGSDGTEHEDGHHPGTPGGRIPIGEVKQHTRCEAGFERAKQKAQHVELGG